MSGGGIIAGRGTRTQGAEIDRVFVLGEEADFIFGKGTQIFPNLPYDLYGMTSSRIVLDAGEKWFEFGFRLDVALSGNAAAGWTDAGNYLRIEMQWTPDLVTWSMGKFVPAPVPVVDLGDGSFEYWGRALNPQDSAVKSGYLRAKSGAFNSGVVGEFGADSRNNPLTALTLGGVVQTLGGGFPYTMPGDAARMQADLRSHGWPTATVTAASDVDWEIYIPAISYSTFQTVSRVSWPQYLVADMFGVVNTPVTGVDFDGEFIDASGAAIYPQAFARLKLSSGSRYDPYH